MRKLNLCYDKIEDAYTEDKVTKAVYCHMFGIKAMGRTVF
jgi:hypothetical protein